VDAASQGQCLLRQPEFLPPSPNPVSKFTLSRSGSLSGAGHSASPDVLLVRVDRIGVTSVTPPDTRRARGPDRKGKGMRQVGAGRVRLGTAGTLLALAGMLLAACGASTASRTPSTSAAKHGSASTSAPTTTAPAVSFTPYTGPYNDLDLNLAEQQGVTPEPSVNIAVHFGPPVPATDPAAAGLSQQDVSCLGPDVDGGGTLIYGKKHSLLVRMDVQLTLAASPSEEVDFYAANSQYTLRQVTDGSQDYVQYLVPTSSGQYNCVAGAGVNDPAGPPGEAPTLSRTLQPNAPYRFTIWAILHALTPGRPVPSADALAQKWYTSIPAVDIHESQTGRPLLTDLTRGKGARLFTCPPNAPNSPNSLLSGVDAGVSLTGLPPSSSTAEYGNPQPCAVVQTIIGYPRDPTAPGG